MHGRDAAATAGVQAAWYFANERVAVPLEDGAVGAAQLRPMHDLRRWSEAHPTRAPLERPPLVWIADPARLRNAQLAGDAQSFALGDAAWPLRLAPRLSTNSAWFDASSAVFFSANGRTALRGHWDQGAFVASALWPEAWRLGPAPPALVALPPAQPAGLALRALMRTDPPDPNFATATLWQRAPGARWQGKAIIAFIVNGAQGDDDEAHAGHFSIATGRIAEDGDLGEWLVDSFYSLDVVSEKGILAAPVPFDRYQGDVNGGQSWYRPSWALVAVLDDGRAAVRVQSALGRVFRHFWRGQLAYYHPTDNCTSIAIDTLRALGLDVPVAGPTGRWTAWLSLPWLALRERSFDKAKSAFDYLVTERTRLLPAIALEAVFESLWPIALGRRGTAGALGREFEQDLVALAWMRIPQIPSSRPSGDVPAVSLAEYRARVPVDPTRQKIIPLAPRALPESLRDDDVLPRLPHPSELAIRWWIVAPLALAALVLLLRS